MKPGLALCIVLAGCGETEPEIVERAGVPVECASGQGEMQPSCALLRETEGVVILRSDGGFRRLLFSEGVYQTADGFHEATQSREGDRIELAVANERYRWTER